MNVAVVRVPIAETQENWPQSRASTLVYTAYAANWKRASRPAHGPNSLIGVFDVSIPQFSLSLRCALKRDRGGSPFVDLPRVLVEAPNGATHSKRLIRWNSAEAERCFQDAALLALRRLLDGTEGAW